MQPQRNTRREAIKKGVGLAGAAACRLPQTRAAGFTRPNSRPKMAAIGTGSRWFIKATGIDRPYGSAPEMRKYADYVAVCDVDSQRRQAASEIVKGWTGSAPEQVLDYRELIQRSDIDIVHISTPDHWHAKIAIEAMLAGKDVYCEKPMTLTIEEGQLMSQVCRRTGRIVQIGTQQRSAKQFLQAIAMVREGRIGTLKKVTCSIGGAPTSPKIPAVKPPNNLNWDLWQGPTPHVPYRRLAGDHGETKGWSRGHYEFRWWYEYSGGKLTDWGAHHVDIATWAMGKTQTGPEKVTPVHVKHPVQFTDGQPDDTTRYNTATEFLFTAQFGDQMELEIRHDRDNGILLEGTDGRIFVNRGRITGAAVERLAERPLPDGALETVYKDRPLTDHFRNFFEAVRDRVEPISDVFSHHRALTTCHLAGIAGRLARTLRWDAESETVLDDELAQSMTSRTSRDGFAIDIH